MIRFRLCLVVCVATTLAACGAQPSLRPAGTRNATITTPSAPTSPQPTATFETLACRLPVFQGAANAQSAGFVSMPSGAFEADPGALGYYYDWPLHRWLGGNIGPLSADGLRYAQGDAGGVRLVDLVTGKSRVFSTGSNADNVLYFAREGIYFNHFPGSQPGLWLLDPSTGKIQTIFTDQSVEGVGGYAAWLPKINSADQQPYTTPDGTLPDELVRRDLNTNDTRVWFYRPGSNVQILGFTADKKPLVLVETGREPVDSIWLVPEANNGQEIYSGAHPSFVADSHGIWISNDEGIFLWSDHGLNKVSTYAGLLAGGCQ